ncbi:hypothetical protein ATANTOWER_023908 [Ataeniobius toweri]|uniref:Secreted protein n=1 Tax=Ataeniobius toweri TaxID=208326 RepID=A0ABU7BMH3_9TELE|nr:hypothetical protein [Ataeniobius toweri]
MPAFALSIALLFWIFDFWRKVSYCRGLRSKIPVYFVWTTTSWHLPVSPSSEPKHKCNLFTLQCKYLHPHKSLKSFQRNFCTVHSDSESLNPPWRLDYSNILAIYQFLHISHLSLFKKVNLLHKPVSSSECFHLHVGQNYLKHNDT